MRVVIIGGTGHVGTHLVPRLVRLGHEVVNISRGNRRPYLPDPTWDDVRQVNLDRVTEEQNGTFGEQVRDLDPECVIDMLCFKAESARHLVEALRGHVQMLLHCGTIWVHGYSTEVPTAEDQRREPFGEYGIDKLQAERYLLDQAHRHGFPATALNPGHIVGQGWAPVGPLACHDLSAFVKLAHGEELVLPNLGMETVHHVHADDVAQAFIRAMANWSAAVGQAFYVVSRAALTLRGFADAVASWYGRTANLRFLPMEEWKAWLPPEFVDSAVAHVEHSSNFSCARAMQRLGFAPRYTSLEAVRESVEWLVTHGELVL